MTSYQRNPVSLAFAMRDSERLRRLAATACTNEGGMALRLLSAMLERQVRLQLEKGTEGHRAVPRSGEAASQILFVDDDPNVHLTLPPILRQHGFDVRAVATVPDALAEIGSHEFDVLISDLNIGQPGDGFTVVSAMRRTQPECVNIILTGYPAFETALRAIQAQVDDYLLKPIDMPSLVTRLKEKLSSARRAPQVATKRLATLLRENIEELRARVLALMKADPELKLLPLSDEERVCHVPAVLAELSDLLEAASASDRAAASAGSSAQYGSIRRQQSYPVHMVVEEGRLLQRAIFQLVQDRIMELELSRLMADLSLLVDTLDWQLHESTRAYMSTEAAA